MSRRPLIGVIGLGLIGGSAAKDFARAGFTVYGYDVDSKTMEQAWADSAIVSSDGDWTAWANQVDWVLVATPLAQVSAWLTRWATEVTRPQVIIDVSSVKGVILPMLSALPDRFTPVCLHPMAGRELTGYEASTVDLFRGRVCAVVPVPNREPASESVIEEILDLLGMRGYPTDGLTHDRVAALVSHLPYLVSAALLVTADRVGAPLGDWPRMAGPGFFDTSRVGSSSPRLWNEILEGNHEAVLPALEMLVQVAEGWVRDLRQGQALQGLETAPEIRRRVEEAHRCD